MAQEGMENAAVVDGSNIKALVDDKNAFNRFVEEKFQSLDCSHTGQLSPQELKPVVVGLGGALGLPPQGSSPETDPIYDQLLKSFLDSKGRKVTKEKFSAVLRDILLGLADGLAREPIKVISLDGKKLREYSQHSDAEVCAVTTFVENDKESSGKVKASLLRSAMKQLSVAHGAPPPSEAGWPLLDAALKRMGVNEETYVDQNAFVEMFKKLLMELAGIMSEKPLTVAHIEKKFDGQSVKEFLSDKKAAKKTISEVWKSLAKDKFGHLPKEKLIYAIDAIAPQAGLPPFGAIEEMDVEMEEALKMIDNGISRENNGGSLDKEQFEQSVRQVLGGILLQLEGKPIVITSSAIVSEVQAGNLNAIF